MMKRVFACLGVASLLAAAACSPGMAPIMPKQAPDSAAATDPRVLKLAQADSAFGFGLLKELSHRDPGKNLFISPFSVGIALEMVLNGARGQTRDQIQGVLDLSDMSLSEVNEGNRQLVHAIANPNQATTVSVANALWFDNDVAIVPEFQSTCAKNYGAPVTRLDFNAPEAAPAVNKWVSGVTRGKIDQLVTSGDLHGMAAVLTNAIYFKGDWLNAFDKGYTKDAPFTAEDGTSRTVPLMHEHRSFDYADSATFQALRAPYQKDQVSLILLLPHQGTSLASVIDGLDAASFESIIGSWTRQDVEFFLPRFKLHYQTSLNKPLDEMGMPLAFGPGANFTGMSPKVGAISNVIHKAVLEVDETGTVAAAATGIVMTKAMAIRNPRPPIVFRADHPFAVVIQDNATGTVLFAGAVYHPGG